MNPDRPEFRQPHLTQASAPLTERVLAIDEHGQAAEVSIPAERALTVYVDKRELVTLMTLGAHPEWLVLGYLRNQRLIGALAEVESITVDWEVGAASVKTRHGIDRIEARTGIGAESSPQSRRSHSPVPAWRSGSEKMSRPPGAAGRRASSGSAPAVLPPRMLSSAGPGRLLARLTVN